MCVFLFSHIYVSYDIIISETLFFRMWNYFFRFEDVSVKTCPSIPEQLKRNILFFNKRNDALS